MPSAGNGRLLEIGRRADRYEGAIALYLDIAMDTAAAAAMAGAGGCYAPVSHRRVA